jgi:PTS system nitrogen regulatory IIA component
MLDLLKGDVPRLDRQNLLTQLLEREKEYTSLLGHGISMPHVHAREIEEAILLVARPEKGIACDHTGGDIDLIFMLLSPEDEHTEHLARISHIARIVGKEADRLALLEAKTTDDLYEAIVTA